MPSPWLGPAADAPFHHCSVARWLGPTARGLPALDFQTWASSEEDGTARAASMSAPFDGAGTLFDALPLRAPLGICLTSDGKRCCILERRRLMFGSKVVKTASPDGR
jgi:hypothetical protein